MIFQFPLKLDMAHIKFSAHSNRLNLLMINIMLIVIFLTFFLPFSPNLIERLDLQPLAPVFLLSLSILLMGKLKLLIRDIFWIFIGIAVAIVNLLLSDEFTDIRVNLAFFTFVFAYIIGFNFFRIIKPELAFKVLKFVIFFWVLVVLLQLFGIDMTALSPNRTTVGRGVTGIAPEPTYAALQLIYFFPLLVVLKNIRVCSEKQFYISVTALFIIALLIHLSSTIYMVVAIALALSLIMSLNNRKLILFLSWLLIAFIILMAFSILNISIVESIIYPFLGLPGLSDLRLTKLVDIALSGSLLIDASAFDRLMSTFKVLFDPYIFPLPRTHSSWIYDINQFIKFFVDDGRLVNESYRNISGLGQLNFILGFLFLIPILGLISNIRSSKALDLICLNVFFIALFVSSPIANPMIGLSLGLLGWQRELNKKSIKQIY